MYKLQIYENYILFWIITHQCQLCVEVSQLKQGEEKSVHSKSNIGSLSFAQENEFHIMLRASNVLMLVGMTIEGFTIFLIFLGHYCWKEQI